MSQQTLTILSIASFVLLLLFGQQFGGLVPWLRRRRKKTTGAEEIHNGQDKTIASTETVIAPLLATPAPPQNKEPRNVEFSRILADRGQTRAAKLALHLQPLVQSVAVFPLYVGVGISTAYWVLSGFTSPHSLVGVFVAYVAVVLYYSGLGLMCVGWALPIFVLHAANVVLQVRSLRE